MEEPSKKDLNKKLAAIQKALVATKSQKNDFGKYNYRSCEDILEAVKPLLPEDCTIILKDEILYLGDRYYVRAIAIFSDGETTLRASAFAREALAQKGMADSQLTGATSSYARKYALNGLLLIDDNKDADHQDNREQMNPDPIDLEKVGKAVKFFKEMIDIDDPDSTFEAIKAGRAKLTNDEWIRAQDGLKGKAPDSNKMYKTLVVEHINYIPGADNE